MKKSLIAALTAAVLSTFALSACNTTQGFGQDVKGAGQDISNSAQQNK